MSQQNTAHDLLGKRIMITGANCGLGLSTAKLLARRGAEIIFACWPSEACKASGELMATEAIATIHQELPNAKLSVLEIDLGDLASIARAAEQFLKQHTSLDILINNAGVMWLPQSKTKDGFETHLGINHLGHFALTGRLLPAILRTRNSRIVTLASLAHKPGTMDMADPFYERRSYDAKAAYSQSKVANLLFYRELGRRLSEAGSTTISVAAHPGVVGTNLMTASTRDSKILGPLMRRGFVAFAQTPDDGARSSIHVATAPDIENGDYFGPTGFFNLFGKPGNAKSNDASKDMNLAKDLWAFSEKETGLSYEIKQQMIS